MRKHRTATSPRSLLLCLSLFLSLSLLGCERPAPAVTVVATYDVTPPPTAPVTPPSAFNNNGSAAADGAAGGAEVVTAATPVVLPRPTYVGQPTPDPTEAGRTTAALLNHTVAAGETLGYLAQLYGTTVEELLTLNGLNETDFLAVGQVLQVPGTAAQTTPDFKLIPDSELVYGPAARDFDAAAYAAYYNGYLNGYTEAVEGQTLSGPAIVMLTAHRFSVNPRLLLALLEYRGGWLTQVNPPQVDYPLGNQTPGSEGLYNQLSWAANQINWGYYGRAEGGLTSLTLADGTRLAYAPGINDGTAGIMRALGAGDDVTETDWLFDVGPAGFFATYTRLFGNPFAYTIDPIWSDGLRQPVLALPWPSGETWYYTGGPHGGWASGAAWSAIDFAPDGDRLGCYESAAWVTAMAAGIVTRSSFGAVVVDLDGDGFAGTGWAIVYMHLSANERIAAGTYVNTGDPLGHPSCEGGYSTGTHLHVSRTFNGRWIAADGIVPFELGGWTAVGYGREYDGGLVRDETEKVACACRDPENAVPNP